MYNYDSLNEYQKRKADWLESSNYSESTKKTYWWHVNSGINPIEKKINKDLSEWDEQKIIEVIEQIPSKKKHYKFYAISKYIDWVLENTDNLIKKNPCDNINISKLLKITVDYKKLEEFYKDLNTLDCTDVDKAMITLLRFGATAKNVGVVKWNDIDKENMILNISEGFSVQQLPIDNNFIEIMEKAKSCKTLFFHQKEINYVDIGFIVKTHEKANWKNIDDTRVRNRISDLSKENNIPRISVPNLINARKYDLLFDKFRYNGIVTNYDLREVLETIEGSSNPQKIVLLKFYFESLSPIKVKEKRKRGGTDETHEDSKNEIGLEEKTSSVSYNTPTNNFIDKEDSAYQDDVYSVASNIISIVNHEYKPKYKKNADTSNHEYSPQDKKDSDKNTTITSTQRRNSKIGFLALKLSNFQCEYDKKHETFISNTTLENYVEAHHIIPMKYYDNFNVSIDNEANIVALCPNCHRLLHYGIFENKVELLKILYNENISNLKKAGINITLKELLDMYR